MNYDPIEAAGARLGKVLAQKIVAGAAAAGAFFLFRWLDSLADTSAGALLFAVLAYALVDIGVAKALRLEDDR